MTSPRSLSLWGPLPLLPVQHHQPEPSVLHPSGWPTSLPPCLWTNKHLERLSNHFLCWPATSHSSSFIFQHAFPDVCPKTVPDPCQLLFPKWFAQSIQLINGEVQIWTSSYLTPVSSLFPLCCSSLYTSNSTCIRLTAPLRFIHWTNFM